VLYEKEIITQTEKNHSPKEKEKLRRQWKTTPHIIQGKGATLVAGTVKLFTLITVICRVKQKIKLKPPGDIGMICLGLPTSCSAIITYRQWWYIKSRPSSACVKFNLLRVSVVCIPIQSCLHQSWMSKCINLHLNQCCAHTASITNVTVSYGA
jgi:hypothetical protein